jgi:hypothetical protein
MSTTQPTFNSKLGLTFDRFIDIELDVRPGGIFRTSMQSPRGKEFSNLVLLLIRSLVRDDLKQAQIADKLQRKVLGFHTWY